MKKRIIIICSIVIAVALIFTGVFFLLSKSDKEQDTASDTEKAIAMQKKVSDIKSIDEFDAFIDEYKYKFGITEDKSVASVYDVSFLDENSYVTFYFDDQGKTTDLSLFYYLNAVESDEGFEITELSLETLSEKSNSAIGKFCNMFDCDFMTDLYLTNNDGTFTIVDSDEKFQAIIDGTAYLDFSLRDKDGFYWRLRISYEEDLAVVNICKYFNIDDYIDHVANISLYEGE